MNFKILSIFILITVFSANAQVDSLSLVTLELNLINKIEQQGNVFNEKLLEFKTLQNNNLNVALKELSTLANNYKITKSKNDCIGLLEATVKYSPFFMSFAFALENVLPFCMI